MTEIDIRPTASTTPPPGSFTIRQDEALDIVRITARGFLTPEQFDEIFAVSARMTEARHATGRPVRFLIDNRQIMIQAPDAVERLRQKAAHAHEEGDRVAIVVESTLARMQLRRVLDMRIHQLFDTEQAALLWLIG